MEFVIVGLILISVGIFCTVIPFRFLAALCMFVYMVVIVVAVVVTINVI